MEKLHLWKQYLVQTVGTVQGGKTVWRVCSTSSAALVLASRPVVHYSYGYLSSYLPANLLSGLST